MVAIIARISSVLNLFLNATLVCRCCYQYLIFNIFPKLVITLSCCCLLFSPQPNPESTARCKAWVCSLLLVGTAGSNPTGGMNISCEYCMLSGRGFCAWPITHPEEFYSVWCVWDWSWSLNNEGAVAHYGLLRHGKQILVTLYDQVSNLSAFNCSFLLSCYLLWPRNNTF
jgi:hypothetical protein